MRFGHSPPYILVDGGFALFGKVAERGSGREDRVVRIFFLHARSGGPASLLADRFLRLWRLRASLCLISKRRDVVLGGTAVQERARLLEALRSPCGGKTRPATW